MNRRVLMSGADYFRVEELNPLSHQDNQPDTERAKNEHDNIHQVLKSIGIDVVKVDAPKNCQDGVYTANWGICRDNKVVLSSLPNRRRDEEPFAKRALRNLGKQIITSPHLFSGQGDAIACGDLLFVGSNYRTDARMHKFLASELGYEVIGLQTIPQLDDAGKPVVNKITGLPDSFFYDIDLCLAVITPKLIAWCPMALMPESQARIRALKLDKIEVSLDEAQNHFACNLVSTGKNVVMSSGAPQLKAAIEARGLTTITPQISELAKGGGYIRCTALTI